MSPTYRFAVELPAGELDLELTVQSGQVFRWVRREDNVWQGIEGDAWFRVICPKKEERIDVTRATGMNLAAGRDALRVNSLRVNTVPPHPESDRKPDAEIFHVESSHPEPVFRDVFRLELLQADIYAELLRRGPELAPYLAATRGLRLMRTRDPVESFFSFLCTPNNNLPRILNMVQHLATYGDDEGGWHRFPTVAAVASIPPEALRSKAFGYRANTIPTAAKFVLEQGGDPWLHGLSKLSYLEAVSELQRVPYVGRKLADCIALHALHLGDVAPIDTHLWQAAIRLYFPEWAEANLTDLKYRTLSHFLRERFGPWTGWAQQVLFMDSVLNWRSRRP